MPKACPLGRTILSWYPINDLHDYGKKSTMNVPNTVIKDNSYYKKCIIMGWDGFNIHPIDVVVRKYFQNQP